MPGTPSWLRNQDEYRAASAADDALGAAAEAMNRCRAIADVVQTAGREHHSDPLWQAAVLVSHVLIEAAAAHGFDVHDVGEEAARRR
ncbi:hypothetical protein [Streptomyces sp. NPDC127119]|uniref:hypothetical protein n=1 Tax=Streptomyces sp. NPDC127119 TaxID=3345370 RepID=UPI003635DEEF